MNPSAQGWIKKTIKVIEAYGQLDDLDIKSFYLSLRESGFIYGNNVTVVHQLIDKRDLSSEELCKLNLFVALYFSHKKLNPEASFLDSIFDFYIKIEEYKKSFFKELLGEKRSFSQLENILHLHMFHKHYIPDPLWNITHTTSPKDLSEYTKPIPK